MIRIKRIMIKIKKSIIMITIMLKKKINKCRKELQ